MQSATRPSSTRPLDADSKQTFVDSVTGSALSKKNKLQTLSTREDDGGIPAHIANLKSQLQTPQNHLVTCDVADVFIIIGAHNVLSTGTILADDNRTLWPAISSLPLTVPDFTLLKWQLAMPGTMPGLTQNTPT